MKKMVSGVIVFFFFKQKTAYEIRKGDWSSDVCSSDLKFGRTYRVQMQADAPFRAQPEDLGAVFVRSTATKEMIPLKSLIKTMNVIGPEQLERFNGFVAARVVGSGKPGVSSGEAIKAVEEVAAANLP